MSSTGDNRSILLKRESKRAYIDKPIPRDVIERLYEKVQWSPSCSNKQPWRLVFVSEKEQHARFMGALARGNQWAAKAPLLVAVCGREKDDVSRDDDPVKYYQFDCGMATLSLLLAAVEEGLMGHPMAGYDANKVKEVLDIPSEYHVMCVISVGYPGTLDDLDDDTRKKDEAPRVRKPLNEIIAEDTFSF